MSTNNPNNPTTNNDDIVDPNEAKIAGLTNDLEEAEKERKKIRAQQSEQEQKIQELEKEIDKVKTLYPTSHSIISLRGDYQELTKEYTHTSQKLTQQEKQTQQLTANLAEAKKQTEPEADTTLSTPPKPMSKKERHNLMSAATKGAKKQKLKAKKDEKGLEAANKKISEYNQKTEKAAKERGRTANKIQELNAQATYDHIQQQRADIRTALDNSKNAIEQKREKLAELNAQQIETRSLVGTEKDQSLAGYTEKELDQLRKQNKAERDNLKKQIKSLNKEITKDEKKHSRRRNIAKQEDNKLDKEAKNLIAENTKLQKELDSRNKEVSAAEQAAQEKRKIKVDLDNDIIRQNPGKLTEVNPHGKIESAAIVPDNSTQSIKGKHKARIPKKDAAQAEKDFNTQSKEAKKQSKAELNEATLEAKKNEQELQKLKEERQPYIKSLNKEIKKLTALEKAAQKTLDALEVQYQRVEKWNQKLFGEAHNKVDQAKAKADLAFAHKTDITQQLAAKVEELRVAHEANQDNTTKSPTKQVRKSQQEEIKNIAKEIGALEKELTKAEKQYNKDYNLLTESQKNVRKVKSEYDKAMQDIQTKVKPLDQTLELQQNAVDRKKRFGIDPIHNKINNIDQQISQNPISKRQAAIEVQKAREVQAQQEALQQAMASREMATRQAAEAANVQQVSQLPQNAQQVHAQQRQAQGQQNQLPQQAHPSQQGGFSQAEQQKLWAAQQGPAQGQQHPPLPQQARPSQQGGFSQTWLQDQGKAQQQQGQQRPLLPQQDQAGQRQAQGQQQQRPQQQQGPKISYQQYAAQYPELQQRVLETQKQLEQFTEMSAKSFSDLQRQNKEAQEAIVMFREENQSLQNTQEHLTENLRNVTEQFDKVRADVQQMQQSNKELLEKMNILIIASEKKDQEIEALRTQVAGVDAREQKPSQSLGTPPMTQEVLLPTPPPPPPLPVNQMESVNTPINEQGTSQQNIASSVSEPLTPPPLSTEKLANFNAALNTPPPTLTKEQLQDLSPLPSTKESANLSASSMPHSPYGLFPSAENRTSQQPTPEVAQPVLASQTLVSLSTTRQDAPNVAQSVSALSQASQVASTASLQTAKSNEAENIVHSSKAENIVHSIQENAQIINTNSSLPGGNLSAPYTPDPGKSKKQITSLTG